MLIQNLTNYCLNTTYIKQIVFEREGVHAITSVGAYYVKSPDSIFVFNRQVIEIALADSIGQVYNRVTLLDKNDKNWGMHYPQYLFSPVVPLMLITPVRVKKIEYPSSHMVIIHLAANCWSSDILSWT